MEAGTRIEIHQNPGRISVQTVSGHIRMQDLRSSEGARARAGSRGITWRRSSGRQYLFAHGCVT